MDGAWAIRSQCGMRTWRASVGRLCLVVFGIGCSSNLISDVVGLPAPRWGAEFAAAECARIFGCCDATEQMRWGYADEAHCRSDAAAQAQKNLDGLLSVGWVTYDAKAAQRCVDEIKTLACTDLVAVGKNLFGPSCATISRGTGKIGATCEDLDVICESSNCLAGPGTCGPTRGCPVICPAGEFCDTSAQACAPFKDQGAPCSSTNECVFPLTCQSSGLCGPLKAGGAPCGAAADCARGSCTDGLCDAMMCDGV